MKVEELISKIREAYLIDPPLTAEQRVWSGLIADLDREKVRPIPTRLNWNFISLPKIWARPSLALALSVFLLVLAGASVQASLPGQTLYPLKRAVEKVIVSLSGSSSLPLKSRADEVVELSKKNAPAPVLESSVDEYKKSAAEAKQGIERVKQEAPARLKEERENLKVQLETNRSKFERALEVAPAGSKIQEKLNEAVTETKKAVEELSRPASPEPPAPLPTAPSLPIPAESDPSQIDLP